MLQFNNNSITSYDTSKAIVRGTSGPNFDQLNVSLNENKLQHCRKLYFLQFNFTLKRHCHCKMVVMGNLAYLRRKIYLKIWGKTC